ASTATLWARSSGPARWGSAPASRRRRSPRRGSGCATRWRWTTTATATAACGCCATSPVTWPASCAAGGPATCAPAASPRTATRPPGGPRSATGWSPPGTPTRNGCSATAATAPAPAELRQLGQVCLARRRQPPDRGGQPAGRAPSIRRDARRGRGTPAAQRRAARAGDHAGAHRADRHAFRLAARRSDRLRDVYIDGIAARIDHEEMRREAARYEGEALTDPLTGLPNRRRLERYLGAVVSRGERVVIGVCDLDGFKAVNTRHGHHSGDLVLQRVAGVINRVMRRGDFVARYGGDEFVVVLPDTVMPEAVEVARRIEAAVRTEDWESLVPGTPVGVTIGFAEVDGSTTVSVREALGTAFELADREMLRAKARPRAS
ncbi:LOW QUALITY PROTEIN: GGDEF protein, partial [Micromonospora sp. M42]